MQTCIVYLIRHSLSFVSWQDRKRLMPALRAIYRAEMADVAEQRLAKFEAKWAGSTRYRPGLAAGLERGRSVLRLSAAIKKMI